MKKIGLNALKRVSRDVSSNTIVVHLSLTHLGLPRFEKQKFAGSTSELLQNTNYIDSNRRSVPRF